MLLIALGANVGGHFGKPLETLGHTVSRLCDHGIRPVAVSGLYLTAPVGGGRQPPYLNAVILARCAIPPAHLLRLVKRIERSAGRRRRGKDGPRPLDIDILDYGGRRLAWPARRCPPVIQEGARKKGRHQRGWLVLPHPEMHRRRFVLEPLLEIAPHWRHPVLGVSPRTLLARLPRRPREIRRALDSGWHSCDYARSMS